MALPNLTESQAFMILNDLPNIGPISLNRLLAEFGGDPVAILTASRRQLEAVRGIGPESSAAIVGWQQHFDLAREEERLARAQASFITPRDAGYPRLLKEIHDPPIGLYRKGNYAFDHPCIAVVGSRRTTLYGQSIAKKLGADLARLGFCVVSGLARGIDTAAHEGALSVGGRTAAVLGPASTSSTRPKISAFIVASPKTVALSCRNSPSGAKPTDNRSPCATALSPA